VFRKELRQAYDLSFGAPPDKGHFTTNNMADVVDRQHAIHHYARHHLKVLSDRTKPITTAWPTSPDARKETKPASTS
jgi:hypothetical protein